MIVFTRETFEGLLIAAEHTKRVLDTMPATSLPQVEAYRALTRAIAAARGIPAVVPS